MLTAKGDEVDKVRTLNLGGDDYVVKPWHRMELQARIRALLRRPKNRETEIYRLGDIVVNITKAEVKIQGNAIQLTPIEFALFSEFLLGEGGVYSRERLQSAVGANSPQAIDNHIMFLRRKIEPDPAKPIYIVTVHGMGYRLAGLTKCD